MYNNAQITRLIEISACFILICLFLVYILFFLKKPFDDAVVKSETWTPEVQQFVENEIEICFPAHFKIIDFKYEKFLDYNILLVFQIPQGELLGTFPSNIFNTAQEFSTYKEHVAMSCDRSLTDKVFNNGRNFLVIKDFKISKPDRKPLVLNLYIILSKPWSMTDKLDEVTVVMTIYES